MAKNTPSIFLSYVLRDRALGERIMASIRRRRPEVEILDHFNLSAAEPWVEKVRDWISNCDVFIVLLTPNSVEADNVLTEMGAAWGLAKPIIKVIPQGYWEGDHLPISLLGQPTLSLEDVDKPEVFDRILQHYLEDSLRQVPAASIV